MILVFEYILTKYLVQWHFSILKEVMSSRTLASVEIPSYVQLCSVSWILSYAHYSLELDVERSYESYDLCI